MNCLNDIEDFTTDQLRAEIYRREQATREGKCWYCQKNLEAHMCKHAKESPVPGWEISPSRWVITEDCMANKQEYWQTTGRHPIMGNVATGIGSTIQEANERCFENIKEKEKKWGVKA